MAWEVNSAKFVVGEKYRLGKWLVGGYHRDGTLPAGDVNRYAVTCLLPGIRSDLGHHATVEEAKAYLETVVRNWLAGATNKSQNLSSKN
jgi:hypothetical protein